MNWIQINGKRSTLIRGLLISSLPPITKPQMRTQTDVIDGRDGDIITPLGYAAYDKPVQVGLHGDFDIDEVIAFFNSSGTVIFSNEPTKYYYFAIIDKVDFARLVRFRTATVNFHVQPFKYSAVESVYVGMTAENLSIPEFSSTKNGVTVIADHEFIKISGTANAETEFIIPINAITARAGARQLEAYTTGSGESAVSFRLIRGADLSPSSTFGGEMKTLESPSITIEETLTETAFFDHLYFYIAPGTAIDTSTDFVFTSTGSPKYVIKNSGNYFSLPKITVHGIGTLTMTINGSAVFTIRLASAEDPDYITIDAAESIAYHGTPETLRNRDVTGDYEKLRLEPGENEITITGTLSAFTADRISRWL